jgi:hypothetical protein
MDAALMLLGLLGLADALDPGFQCVGTQWIRGFMAFLLIRRIRTVIYCCDCWQAIWREGR